MNCSKWLGLYAGLAMLVVSSQMIDSVVAQEEKNKAEHDALLEIRAVVEKAINGNELDLIEPYLDENFSVVTYTDREFIDFKKFKSRWNKTRKEMLSGGSYTTELIPQPSQIFGDIAVARGTSNNVLITGKGKKFEFTSNWSAVLHKVDGNWKLVRAHSSLSPFDNPMLKAGVRKAIVVAGTVALVVGLVLGWIARALIARRKAKSAPE